MAVGGCAIPLVLSCLHTPLLRSQRASCRTPPPPPTRDSAGSSASTASAVHNPSVFTTCCPPCACTLSSWPPASLLSVTPNRRRPFASCCFHRCTMPPTTHTLELTRVQFSIAASRRTISVSIHANSIKVLPGSYNLPHRAKHAALCDGRHNTQKQTTPARGSIIDGGRRCGWGRHNSGEKAATAAAGGGMLRLGQAWTASNETSSQTQPAVTGVPATRQSPPAS